MAINPYLSVLSKNLSNFIDVFNDLKFMLDEFEHESSHVEGLNGKNPVPLIISVQNSLDDSLLQLGKLKDFLKEAQEK